MFWIKMHENTIRNPNLMQVDDQDSMGCLKHCIWFCSLQEGGAGAEEGSRRGKQRWFLSQRTETAFTLKFTFLFLIALGLHTFINISRPVCVPPLSPNLCRSPIRSIAWQGGLDWCW